MSSSDDQGSPIPTRTIHEAYRDALNARRHYRQAAGSPLEPEAHENLQEAVAAYYEVLRPLLSSANACEKLWEEEELWAVEPRFREVAICSACNIYVGIDDAPETPLTIGTGCPDCGEGVIERRQIPETDDEGEIVYRYVTGLASVEDIWDQRIEREVEYEDALGQHSETRVETRLVPPEHLRTIARKLDEALRKLDLHAGFEDDLPKGGMVQDQ